MKLLAKLLAAVLACCIGIQPTVAQAQTVRMQTGQVNAGPASAMAVPRIDLGPSAVSGRRIEFSAGGSVLPSAAGVELAPSAAANGAGPVAAQAPVPGFSSPVMPASPEASVPAQAAAPVVPGSVRRAPAPDPAQGPVAAPESKDAGLRGRVSRTAESVDAAAKGIDAAKTDEAGRDAVAAQFNALTGESFLPARPGEETAPAAQAQERTNASGLAKPGLTQASQEGPEVPAVPSAQAGEKKPGITEVFKDPERNRSFWRYLKGYAVFLFGFQMYMVGLPYLISAFTKNTLKESGDARLENAEALKALIRQNRSLSRVAHWVSQAFSYFTIPLFAAKNADNPKKWLVRSLVIRSAILVSAVGLFFASGWFSMPVALGLLFGLIGLHSFFQGITVTMESAAKTRVFGDKSVTPEERRKANSIMTFVAAAISIVGPAIAGQISMVKELFGKTGVGGAIVYGIYGIGVGIAGLIYASIKLFGNKAAKEEAARRAGAAPAQAADGKASPAKGGVLGVIKNLGKSLKDGIVLIWRNRFLRTMLGMTLVSYLFSDPLVFNVLPEFAGNIIQSNSALQAILNLPVIGWFFKGLTSTPMGYFALMNVMASVGSIAATALVKPLTRLFNKLGFRTEESLTIPFYFIAALEAPLFWLMIFSPSMLSVVILYGLQSFVLGFAGIAVSGVDQKVSGSFSKEDLPKVLAAQSFVGIVAAIISTLVYGFMLGNIPIATSLTIAAIATTVLAALRIAAPWLAFSKAQRN